MIELYLEIFTEFDKNKDGIQSVIPDASNEEMFKLGLNLFNIYNAERDKIIKQKRSIAAMEKTIRIEGMATGIWQVTK